MTGRSELDRNFDLLMRNRYGLPAVKPSAGRAVGQSVTMTVDAGTDVLPQPGSVTAEELPEYVVDRVPAVIPRPTEPPAPTVQPPPAVQPVTPSPAAAPAADMSPPPPQPVAESQPPRPQPQPAVMEPMPRPAPAPDPQQAEIPASIAGSPLTDADLANDIRAILSGGGSGQSAAATMSDPGRPSDAPNTQAIFDKIAQSMQYSNSFDLGTYNVLNPQRFEQFEKNAAASALSTEPKRDDPSTVTPPTEPEIPPEATSGVSLVPGCGGSALTMAVAPERSVPMYDTGEHVLSAGDLYPDQLIVGSGAGVAFSYGQLIAMGDFYDTVDDLKNADPAELSRLKALIVRDTAFYRKPISARRKDDPDDISHKEWDKATSKRYLALADQNYAHFSPPDVLGLTDHTTKPNNRSEWEKYHERAITEMQALVAANPNASVAPFGPLATNAFGDHFLTDAFASGHMVNKEVVIDRFRSRFFQGTNTLTPAAEDFLTRLAAAAWAFPEVRTTFSKLELASRDFNKLFIKWNIDTENAFRKLLVQIAEREPAKVENLAAKTLHDYLNRTGIEVVNDHGDGPWLLRGDGYLDTPTLPIMRQAVQQSVDNILSPEILVSEADRGPLSVSHHGPLLARVWKYVPKPTATGRATALAALDTYTDLNSPALLQAAAELLKGQRQLIADALLERKFLQEDK